MSHARSSTELSRGTTWPVMAAVGLRSKVKAEATAPSSLDVSTTRFSRAPWPRWTPSKKPRAMTRLLLFKTNYSPLQARTGSYTSKKLLMVRRVPRSTRLRDRNSPVAPYTRYSPSSVPGRGKDTPLRTFFSASGRRRSSGRPEK